MKSAALAAANRDTRWLHSQVTASANQVAVASSERDEALALCEAFATRLAEVSTPQSARHGTGENEGDAEQMSTLLDSRRLRADLASVDSRVAELRAAQAAAAQRADAHRAESEAERRTLSRVRRERDATRAELRRLREFEVQWRAAQQLLDETRARADALASEVASTKESQRAALRERDELRRASTELEARLAAAAAFISDPRLPSAAPRTAPTVQHSAVPRPAGGDDFDPEDSLPATFGVPPASLYQSTASAAAPPQQLRASALRWFETHEEPLQLPSASRPKPSPSRQNIAARESARAPVSLQDDPASFSRAWAPPPPRSESSSVSLASSPHSADSFDSFDAQVAAAVAAGRKALESARIVAHVSPTVGAPRARLQDEQDAPSAASSLSALLQQRHNGAASSPLPTRPTARSSPTARLSALRAIAASDLSLRQSALDASLDGGGGPLVNDSFSDLLSSHTSKFDARSRS